MQIRTFPKFNKGSCSLCQRLGLTRSVRNKPQARSASIERQRRESSPEVKDERSESFAGGARVLHHEGANTQKLSLDKRLRKLLLYFVMFLFAEKSIL